MATTTYFGRECTEQERDKFLSKRITRSRNACIRNIYADETDWDLPNLAEVLIIWGDNSSFHYILDLDSKDESYGAGFVENCRRDGCRIHTKLLLTSEDKRQARFRMLKQRIAERLRPVIQRKIATAQMNIKALERKMATNQKRIANLEKL